MGREGVKEEKTGVKQENKRKNREEKTLQQIAKLTPTVHSPRGKASYNAFKLGI